MLAGGHRGNVDPDKLTHVPRQGGSSPAAGFFGDGEQRVTVDLRLFATFHNRLQRGQQSGHPGFVIQMPGADVAAFGEFRQWVERHEVPHVDPQRIAVGAGRAVRIKAQLDVVPTDRQFIDAGVEGMP